MGISLRRKRRRERNGKGKGGPKRGMRRLVQLPTRAGDLSARESYKLALLESLVKGIEGRGGPKEEKMNRPKRPFFIKGSRNDCLAEIDVVPVREGRGFGSRGHSQRWSSRQPQGAEKNTRASIGNGPIPINSGEKH